MARHFKATRTDGTDFYSGTIDYAAPDTDSLPNKVACTSLRVVEEVSATLALGPQGTQISTLIERAAQINVTEIENLAAARAAAWDAAWDAAGAAAWDAAWDAAWGAARAAAWDAVWDAAGAAAGLLVRDLIGQNGFTQEHYDLLTEVWRKAIGPIHPDDAPLGEPS